MGRTPFAVRPISAHERAVLAHAVLRAAADNVEMPSLDQLDTLQVVAKCPCGCASVDFRQLRPGETAELVADAMAETTNGEQVGVLVFAFDGSFVGLEIVGYGDAPAPLPVVSTVRGWTSHPMRFDA